MFSANCTQCTKCDTMVSKELFKIIRAWIYVLPHFSNTASRFESLLVSQLENLIIILLLIAKLQNKLQLYLSSDYIH